MALTHEQVVKLHSLLRLEYQLGIHSHSGEWCLYDPLKTTLDALDGSNGFHLTDANLPDLIEEAYTYQFG